MTFHFCLTIRIRYAGLMHGVLASIRSKAYTVMIQFAANKLTTKVRPALSPNLSRVVFTKEQLNTWSPRKQLPKRITVKQKMN
jgi:hypothetical protein